MVVDYPNSKKARKVFLCLFVGGGGQTEVPRGLDGVVAGEEGGKKAVFERRREKEKRRSKGKRKDIKAKDWILKKKEVSSYVLRISSYLLYFVAVSPTRERECTERFKIYRQEAPSCLLASFVIFHAIQLYYIN